MKKYIIIKTISILILVTSNLYSQVKFQVDGNVFLEDSLAVSGTHENIQITFFNLPSMDPEDSTYSDETGYFHFNVSPGYYLVTWTKDGYVPWELGGLALANNSTLSDVTLVPGAVQEVSGFVYGNWTTGYVYWVMDDITVPDGAILTIDAGVRVKFAEGKGMICEGTLIANGNEDNHILFTSREPTPIPGDWTNIVLNGENNVFTYVDYEWADDGITGSGASGSTFDNLYINGSLSLDANGIYLENSSDMTFTNNEIMVLGDEILYCSGASNSTFTGNLLTGSGRGIYANNAQGSTVTDNLITTDNGTAAVEMDYCHDCLFDNNTILNRPNDGFRVRYSNNATFTNNTLEVYQYGFNCNDGSYYTFDNNTINDFDEQGIYFGGSENCTVTNNYIYDNETGGYKIGIHNTSGGANAVVSGNYVNLYNANSYDNHIYGIHVYYSEITNNEVYINQNNYLRNHGYGIYCNYSTIQDNYVYVRDDSDYNGRIGYGIINNGENSDNLSLTENNTVIADYETLGFEGNYAVVRNNIFKGIDEETGTTVNHEWAIMGGNYNEIYDNTMIGFRDGIHVDGDWDVTIEDNYIESRYWGIYANNAHGNLVIKNNTLDKYTTEGDWLIYVTNTDSVVVMGNDMRADGGSGIYVSNTVLDITWNLVETPGRGLDISNQVTGPVANNTFISTGGGDYGMYITDLSDPDIFNNIIQGFQTGVRAESYVSNISFNNLWNNDAISSGAGIPDLIGEVVTVNSNGDPSDVYANIFLNPLFRGGNDYRLSYGSPCINSGTNDILDPDGTPNDIGAFYYNPSGTIAAGTAPGTITLSWVAASTDSLDVYDIDYRILGDIDFTDLTETTDTVFLSTNLTDGTYYEFQLRERYTHGSYSQPSFAISQAGIPDIGSSLSYVEFELNEGDSSFQTLTVINEGGQDLFVSLTMNSNQSHYSDTTEIAGYDDELIYSCYLDFTGPSSCTSPNLVAGNYYLKLSGIYSYGSQNCVDAAFHFCNWQEPVEPSQRISWTWNCPAGDSSCQEHLPTPNIYNDDHIYYYPFISDGGSETIYGMHDGWYNDNYGGLTVEFWRTGVHTPNWLTIDNQEFVIPFGSTEEVLLSLYANTSPGAYFADLLINSNDINQPNMVIPVAMGVSGETVAAPPEYFIPVNQDGDEYHIYIAHISLDGMLADMGDEVAVLDGDVVVGAVQYLGEFPLIIPLAGFTPGNDISFLMYDYSTAREAQTITQYQWGDGTFGDGGFSAVTLDASIYHARSIFLEQKRINLISFNLYPKNADAETLFGDLDSLGIVYTDLGNVYIPEYSINTINALNITEGYHIYSAIDDVISYTGLPQNLSNWPITIEPYRFNSIGYLLNEEKSAELVFTDIQDSIEIVLNDDGLIYIPELGINTLGNMKPGEGYMIFLSSDESVTLYYSDDETLARKNNIAPEYNTSSPSSNHYSYIETGIPHAVVVKEIIINNGNFQLVPGDEIALFDEDVCVGSATFDGNYPFNITAWRSYSDAGLNGYSAGNPIDAVLYITDADIEIELSVESINGSPIKYGEGAYAYILLNGASDSLGDLNTLLPNEYSLEQNYPNPFNPITNIKYHVPSLSNITIKVYNVQGEKVCTLVDRYHDPGYYDIAWDGEDNKGIQLASGIYFSEMRAINTDREYVEIRKMTLLK